MTENESWRTLTEALPQLVWTAGPDGACEYFSTQWTEYSGIPESEMLGWQWMELLHPDDREPTRQYWLDSVAGRIRYDVEYRVRRRDGVYGWFKTRGTPIRDNDGNIVRWFGTCTDITDQKRAEDALKCSERELLEARSDLEREVVARTAELRRSEAYLAEAQKLTNTGSWARNPFTGEVLYCSEEALRIWGFDPQEGLPTFERLLQRFIPEDGERVRDLVQDAVRRKAEYVYTCRMVLPDETMKYVEVIGHPTFNTAGEVAEYVGTARDVTERIKAEEERQAHLWFLESMDRVNRAIQGTDDLEQMMSDVLDAVLSIFDCDRAWLVYPCDPGAASWRAPMEHVRPKYPGVFALGGELPMSPDIARAFQTVRASSVPVRFGHGSEHPVPEVAQKLCVQSQIAMAIYPKVDKPYMFGLHQCSHARAWTPQEERLLQEIGRRLADALTTLLMFRNLQESEARLEESQRVAHVGYWVRDLDTGRLTWSDETFRIFGLRPQDHTIDSKEMEAFILPDDRPIMASARVEALAGHARYDVEYRVARPSGEVRTVHSQGEVTRDASGRPSRMFGTIQDITERKRAEEALQQAQAELAHITRVATLGELTSSIAHEMNQPLTAIVANGSACLRWLAGQPPNLAEARQAVERIVKEGHRAGEVIRRIRALVKHSPPQRETLDINEIIREVIALAHSEAQKYRVLLQTKLSRELPMVLGDRVQLQQVILNLVINGLESTNDVSAEAREMIINSSTTGRNIVVQVRDCGEGLDDEHLSKLFDAFYTTKPSGMGMGLAISRSIVDAHGGRIWAEPNSPRGAVFQFSLPVDDESAT